MAVDCPADASLGGAADELGGTAQQNSGSGKGARETLRSAKHEREEESTRDGMLSDRAQCESARGTSGGVHDVPLPRKSVRAIAIIDFPFFPTAGNASPADYPMTLAPDAGFCPVSSRRSSSIFAAACGRTGAGGSYERDCDCRIAENGKHTRHPSHFSSHIDRSVSV
jgi:hypothetical protein